MIYSRAVTKELTMLIVGSRVEILEWMKVPCPGRQKVQFHQINCVKE